VHEGEGVEERKKRLGSASGEVQVRRKRGMKKVGWQAKCVG